MNIVEKIKWLKEQHGESVEIGSSFYLFSKGWLNIDENDDAYHVMYTSAKDTHNPLSGPALGVDFTKATGDRYKRYGLSGAWRSALSMWPVRDEVEAHQVYMQVRRYIKSAYDYNMNK